MKPFEEVNFTLIRGLTRESFHWNEFPKFLLKEFPHSKIDFIDLPGNGIFCHEQSPLTASSYIKFVRSKSENVRYKKKTVLIAVSFAAMISALWAAQFPEEIEAVIFINTSFRPTPLFYRLRPTGLLRLLKIMRIRNSFLKEKSILDLTSELSESEKSQLAQQWGARTLEFETTSLNALRQLLVAASIQIPPISTTTKSLILCSRKDRLVDFKSSEKIAQKLKIPLKIHPSAGHDLTLDDPQWVSKMVAQFILKPAYRST